jgi:hypothetical protein
VSNQGRWLDDPANETEAALAAALAEARARVPDEVTLRRLWGKVADFEPEPQPLLLRPPRARWRWFVGGVVTSSALAVALALWLWPGRTAIESGAVTIAPAVPGGVAGAGAGHDRAAAAMPRDRANPPPVKSPAVARTAAGETMHLTLRGGAEARLGPASLVNIDTQADGSERPVVKQGDVGFSVPHQPPGQTFSVAAGPYRIVVIGTKFHLRVDGSRVAVTVDEGVVEVWRRRRLARLVPGDSWSSASDSGGTGPAAVGGGGEPARTGRAAASGATTATPGASASSAAGGSGDPAQEARAALAAGEPHRALDAYRAAAARGGPAGENAEYEIGRILRDRLGHSGEAIAAWKRYRSLHPDGLLRIETDVSIIETLVSSGDSAAALGEANDFLRRHGDSERRGEIARVAGDLYRARGDCARALDAYQVAVAAARSRDVKEYATFHRAACLVSMGEDKGRAALEDYLGAWPSGRFSADASRLLHAPDDHGRR